MTERGDVVSFEFCLHEMDEAAAVLRRAKTLAPDTLVTDHAPSRHGAPYGFTPAGSDS